MQFNDRVEFDRFINDIHLAKNNLSFVCFTGAGVSISQGYPNWDQYVMQLINYWTFHLETLTSLESTRNDRVDLHDISMLQDLTRSFESNKRKVDMVNYLVKKYCDTGNELTSEEIYRKHVLDFEKFIFSNVSPIIAKNEVLDELVKLRPSFITTNYDDQIEKSYRRNFAITPDIVPDIKSIDGSLRTETVIHLHGVPDGNKDFFVSSSQSYAKVYYEENDFRRKIRTLFKGKENSVVLFVGCSMEEDEILSLLDLEKDNVKFYALMKYSLNNNIHQVNQRKNDFIKEYYIDQHRVNIIWFGDKFSDLPIFIKYIVDALQKKEKESSPHPEEIRKVLLDG